MVNLSEASNSAPLAGLASMLFLGIRNNFLWPDDTLKVVTPELNSAADLCRYVLDGFVPFGISWPTRSKKAQRHVIASMLVAMLILL